MYHRSAPTKGTPRAELKKLREQQLRHRRAMAAATSVCLLGLIIGTALDYSGVRSAISLMAFIPAYVAGAWFSLRNAVHDLREGRVNVDLLMVCAAFGAASVGEWPEGAVLLFLFSLSGTLEQYILGRTRRAIEELMDLAPDEAVVLRDGVETRIPVESLEVGDVMIVRPGEKIPGDGVIMSGSTTIDQSMITGESIPVERNAGDQIFAGTLNQAGAIEARVKRRASESTIARIVKLVEEAQSERAESQRFTEWFGERYTLIVLFGSLLTAVVSFFLFGFSFHDAFYRAMTVMVVASPCAVVIAIPAALLSAIAAAAREGVLFKGGAHLEQMARIRSIAFDKTGTLTAGKPGVVFVVCAPGRSESEVIGLAASAEKLSEHPLAKAIVRRAESDGISLQPASEFKAIVGKGARATVEGRTVFIGKPELFAAVPKELNDAFVRLGSEGNTVVFVGTETEPWGILALADVVRPNAKEAIERLLALGVEKLVMLTGDNAIVAGAMANKLGLGFAAEQKPEDKVNAIRELKKQYETVAMVGDGINDAPSLAIATAGISLAGTGTAVALETADVVLMSDNLLHIPYAISLGRETLRIIRQNLVFAFSVMGLLLAAAFLTKLPLPIAVAGHEGSTVLVILNGLRLLSRRSGLGKN